MTQDAAPARPGPTRRLYNWTMRLARGRHAWPALGAVSFAESSFFPIPPDVMLVPMALADRQRALLLAAWCTAASVIGGLFGYAIGALLFDSVGQWLINLYGAEHHMDTFKGWYAEYGAWVVLVAGITPFPYKIVTIASGIVGYNLALFIVLSIIARGARFFMVAGLIYFFGEPIRDFIERRMEMVGFGMLGLLVGGFLLVRYVA